MPRPPRRTSSTRRPTAPARALAVCVLAAAGAVTLAACGNSGVAEQSDEHTTETAANGHVGSVLLRNAQITLGSGDGSGSLSVTLYDSGASPDTLTGVTSPEASEFTLPTLGADGAAPAAATRATAVTLPVMTAVPLVAGTDAGTGVRTGAITIAGLTGSPQVGDAIPVTFTFTGAGTVTLDVPVVSDLPPTFSPEPAVTDANVAGGPSGSPSTG